MGFWSLLFVVSQSCAQILLMCATGYICAYKGIINPTVQKGISALSVAILTPCYLFSQIALAIDIEMLVRLWPIAAFLSLYVVVGTMLGLLGGKILRVSKPETNFIIVAIVFNNLTSINVSLLKNLQDTPAIQYFLIDEDDTPVDAVRRGISFALLATLLSNFLRKPILAKLINKILTIVKATRKMMNPPLYAAIGALIVGTIPTLKSQFFGSNAILYPTVTTTMINLGNLMIPVTLLLLGTQLYNNQPTRKNSEFFPTIGWVALSRFLLVPLLGIPLVYFTRSWYNYYDPMLWFVLMLLSTNPTAINCVNITHLTGTFEEEMSTLLFYTYLITAPILSFMVMLMIVLIENAKLS
ncbi:825_t:CDS:2 [Ambispora leptoticha]|uniref:825_t:CDS:1 n=1 Tax=Ambispora leptoticha TaxID=144679 RepID=A0A9N9D2T8_9GLOM|nr:825_t:CDS:2 [Ambispora leptoticha]